MSARAAAGDLRDIVLERAKSQAALIPETADEADTATESRGRGRPPNAVNRATRELRGYILARFTDPATGLAATGLASNPESSVVKAIALAKCLGCKPIEALELMRKCSDALMRYVHSPQPMAVQLQGKVAHLHFGLGMDAGAARLDGDGIAGLLDLAAKSAGYEKPAEESLTDEVSREGQAVEE